MTSFQCPVVRAIAEIKTAGWHSSDDTCAVKVGGATYICDDVSYYISMRKISLARFELSQPTLAQCIAKSAEMFHEGRSLLDLYSGLICTSTSTVFLRNVIKNILALVSSLESIILDLIDKSPNVTLPSLCIDNSDNALCSPRLVQGVANSIIQYINTLNVNELLVAPIIINIDKVGDPIDDSALTGVVPALGAPRSAQAALEQMRNMLSVEMIAAGCAAKAEQYFVDVLRQLGKVTDACIMINDALKQSHEKKI